MSWQAIAERAAKARCASILARVEAAVGQHAPDASIERGAESLRVRGRGVRTLWLIEPGLRFARRIWP